MAVVRLNCQHLNASEVNMPIYHEGKGGIKKNLSQESPFGITLLADRSRGTNFLFHPHTNNGFFFLLTIKYVAEHTEIRHYMQLSL